MVKKITANAVILICRTLENIRIISLGLNQRADAFRTQHFSDLPVAFHD